MLNRKQLIAFWCCILAASTILLLAWNADVSRWSSSHAPTGICCLWNPVTQESGKSYENEAVVIQTGTPGADHFGCMLVNSDGDAYDFRGGFIPRGAYKVVGVVYDCIPAENAATTATAATTMAPATLPPGGPDPRAANLRARRFVRRTIH